MRMFFKMCRTQPQSNKTVFHLGIFLSAAPLKVTCSLTASLNGARISSMLPSIVRPSASCTHRLWLSFFFFFLHKQTDVENGLFWVLLPRDRRASRTVDTGQTERSCVLVRSSADAALRSMDRRNKRAEWWNLRGQVSAASASRWHFRHNTNLATLSADSSFYSLFYYSLKK